LQCWMLIAPPLPGWHAPVQVDDVPGGDIKWQLPWDQMLTAELAYHQREPGAGTLGVPVLGGR
jgi:hypothetical protein